jgi:hemerythrin
MNWGAQYSVRVSKFDNDHEHLFAMVNDLNDAMRAGKGKAILKQVLLGLAAYTDQHFAAEEIAMKRTLYPEYPVHMGEHRKLTTKVHDFVKEFEAGNALVSVELLVFLRDWLENHINVTDKKYAAHMNAHGVC